MSIDIGSTAPGGQTPEMGLPVVVVDPTVQQLAELYALEDQQALEDLNGKDKHEHRVRGVVAGLYVGALALAGGAVALGKGSDFHISITVPYIAEAQQVVNSIQGDLAIAGGVSLVSGVAAMTASKAGSFFNDKLESIEALSSRNMADIASDAKDDAVDVKPSLGRRFLEAGFAGRFPAVLVLGAGLSVFSAGVSTEVVDGSQRPIENAIDALHADSMIVEYPEALPMSQSSVSRNLANAVIAEAKRRDINATIFDQNLGVLTRNKQSLPVLTVGLEFPVNSPLYVPTGDNMCESVPVAVDPKQHIPLGAEFTISGTNVRAVAEHPGISAPGRIGAIMSADAMAACLNGSPEASVHSIALQTNATEAASILAAANPDHLPSAAISTKHYLRNSLAFWKSNVLAITGVISLMGGLYASVQGGSKSRESMETNRRSWAGKMGDAGGKYFVRSTESMRLVKDGVLAAAVGGAAGMVATPVALSALEPGFSATMGIKQFLPGAAVAIGGSFIGAAKSLIDPEKVIHEEASIRG